MITDITEILFGFGTPTVVEPVPYEYRFPPFPHFFFDNRINLVKRIDATSPGGGTVDTWPADSAIPYDASVQPKTVTLVDPRGMVIVSTQYDVFTPVDIGAKARDRILWKGKVLNPRGPTMDEGGNRVIWRTVCMETT
jgi:hypothetical protein